MSFPHFKTSCTQIGHCYLYRQQLKTFDSKNFALSLMFSFQTEWPIKKSCVYFSSFACIHSFPCKNRITAQQAVAGGKFYRLPPDKEDTG